MNIYLVIFITLIAALIASFSQILYKKALSKRLGGIRELVLAFKNKKLVAGLAGYLLSLVIYLYALANAPLSVVYPLFASTFIFITILSALILGEKVNPRRAAGVLLVFLGIVIIAFSTAVV